MADPLATAGPAAAPLGTPTPSGTSPASTGASIPTFAPPKSTGIQGPDAQYEAMGQNWVWDKLGRFVTGGNITDEKGSHGNFIADLPVIGDILRAPGGLMENVITKPLGFGVGKVVEGVAAGLGTLPSVSHLGDNAGLGSDLHSNVNFQDPKYDVSVKGPDAAKALFDDLRTENGSGNFARQFLVIGQWMKQYDPEAFAEWQKTLDEAQKQSGFGAHGVEAITNFISKWGAAYADMTTYGIQNDYLETAPELYYGGSGSMGQGLVRDLGVVFNLQKHAEKGAAFLTGSIGGGIGPIPVGIHNMYAIDGVVQQDMGSRLNELRYYLANDPSKLSPVEKQVALMIESGKWDADHAYNFLVSHGQGYTSNPAAEMVMTFATDPIGVATMGAGLASSVGGKAIYAGARAGEGSRAAELAAQAANISGKTAESTSRLRAMYTAGARSIGTTVAEVQANPILGPASKLMRSVIDPFSALPGAGGKATVDVMGASGLKATERGFGASALSNAARRAKEWGVSDAFTRNLAVTSGNFARKFVANDYVANVLRFTETSARRVIPEELVQELTAGAAKDAVTRMADFINAHKQVYLNAAGLDQLAARMARMTGKTIDEMRTAVASMAPDEQSLWHALTYSDAWSKFVAAVKSVPQDAWGHLSARLQDMVILNPNELDHVAAGDLLKALQDAKPAQRIKLWNEAADRYSIIDNMGRVQAGGNNVMARNMDRLERIINQGGLHHALNPDEMANLPKKFLDEYLGAMVDAEGKPLWRIGFKPMSEQATGLIRNAEGDLVQAFAPTIDNIAENGAAMARRYQPLTDFLGRTVGEAAQGTRLGRAALIGKDSLEVAINTARDSITGNRIAQTMENNFVRIVKNHDTLGVALSEKQARNVFRLARDAAQRDGFTLAGMSPEEFWRASQPVLKDVLDQRVAKRELFTALARASGGDLRVLGLTSGMTQRIRAGLIARGLDPNNYVGAVTVKLYNQLRYALNPTFFLQAEFDAPWFNIYRGVMPVGGHAPEVGSALWQMDRITNAIGHSGIARDLQMDFTERVATIGWQRAVVDQLGAMPGVKNAIGNRLKNWTGRMILNNELAFVNSRIGNVVFDALDQIRATLDDKIANATTEAERASWEAVQQDQIKMLDHLQEQFVEAHGRVATREELGREYLTRMIDDSRLEVRTADGLLHYKKVMSKGEYIKPTDVGAIRPLDLEYGVESLSLPNIHSVSDLRAALRDETVNIGQIKDIMKAEGFHKDAIKRFTTAVQFNWRHYFDDLAKELKLTRYEMQGVEDIVARAAKEAGMRPVDYLTQVMNLTNDAGLDGNVRFIIQTQKAIAKGEVATQDVAKLAAMHLQPSMRSRLLNHFVTALEGPDGLIQKAYDGAAAATTQAEKDAYTLTGQELQKTLESLKGGWGPDAERMYKDLVIRRAGGEVTAMGETLPQPWKQGAYAPKTELVPLDQIDPFMEIDREVTPKWRGDPGNLDRITEDVRVNGFQEPLIIEYDPKIGKALLVEDNHRLAAAKRLGLDRVPVRVVRGDLSGEAKAVSLADRNMEPVLKPKPDGYFPGDTTPSSIGFNTSPLIMDSEVERGARFFSQYLQSIDPKVLIGNELNSIVENIPTEGASAHDFTQGLLMNALAENFRLAEKDAIRLAHIQPERTMLERSLNHPFFGMYPSSYFWGKVIPETFKFVAMEPFGMKTGLGAEAYYKVQQSIALQSQYDPRMKELWDSLGKSAVVSLLSYLSPSMPWEDMKSSLPPWVRSLSKNGLDFQKMLTAELDTVTPERWVSHFMDAAGEVGGAASGIISPQQPTKTMPGGITIPQAQGLEQITQGSGPLGGGTPEPKGNIAPTKGTGLAPILTNELDELQKALAGG